MARCPPRLQCRGVVAPLSHIMLQSDPLAIEFNEILNGVEIFAPFQPLDPAVIFYAPLHRTVRDLRLSQDLFERASEAWRKDGNGIYRRAGLNEPRFEGNELLMEPAGTNICENYNARPDPILTNVTLGGSGVLERVNDAAALAAAGLADIGNGYAIRVLSQGGTANANITGQSATSYSSISAWIKKIGTTGTVQLRTSGGTLVQGITNQEYERISLAGPVNDNELLQVRCTSDAEAFFVLNQFEVSQVASSPIITEGTAGQRAVDLLHWDDPAFNQPEGMAIAHYRPGFASTAFPAGVAQQQGIISNRVTNNTGVSRLLHTVGGSLTFQTTDGANNNPTVLGPPFDSEDLFTVATRWNSSPAALQIGIKHNSDPWNWGAEDNYSGSFATEDVIAIGVLIDYPHRFSNVYLYNEDRGRAWIEDNH